MRCIDVVYVIGGYVQLSTGLEVVDEIWVNNILANRWCRLTLHNSPFHLAISACTIVIGKRILIHGSTGNSFAQDVKSTIIKIKVVTGKCKEHPCLPNDGKEQNIPEATNGHSLTYVCLSGSQTEIDRECSSKLVALVLHLNVKYTICIYQSQWYKQKGQDEKESCGELVDAND